MPANDSAVVRPNYRVKKAEGRSGFAIDQYDTERPLVIRPVQNRNLQHSEMQVDQAADVGLVAATGKAS